MREHDRARSSEPCAGGGRDPSRPGPDAAGQQAAGLDLSSYFDDPDGDALTYAAASTDPAVATAEVSGASLLITAVVAGKVTVTVIATDPGGLFAAQSTGVAVASENSAPVPVGSIPTQNLGAGTSVHVGPGRLLHDPDGDELGYEATSDNTDVATAGVTGAASRSAPSRTDRPR